MTLNVTVTGSGPDLALIHGWGFPAAVWEPVLPALAQRFRVHCVDLPGYGGSRGLPAGRIQDFADQLMAALPESVSLCGWSLGGHVAVAALARHRQRVRELILVGANPCFVKRPDWPNGIEPALLDLFVGALRRDPASLLGRFAALIHQGDASARDLTRRCTALVADPPAAEALASGLAWLRDLDLRPLLPKLTVPTLLIHGEADPLMPLAAAQWAADRLPDGRLACFAGAAHAPFLSQPERFVAAVADFVAARRELSAPC